MKEPNPDFILEQSEAIEAEFHRFFDAEIKDQPHLDTPEIRQACLYFYSCGGRKALEQTRAIYPQLFGDPPRERS